MRVSPVKSMGELAALRPNESGGVTRFFKQIGDGERESDNE